MDATIPVERFSRGELPGICPRHGEPATESYRLLARERLSAWQVVVHTVLAIFPGGFLIDAVLRRLRPSPMVWGYLSRCRQCRLAQLQAIAILAILWVCLWIAFLPSTTAIDGWGFFVWLGVMGYLCVLSVRAYRPPGLTVLLSKDGEQVLLKGVSDTFVTQLSGVTWTSPFGTPGPRPADFEVPESRRSKAERWTKRALSVIAIEIALLALIGSWIDVYRGDGGTASIVSAIVASAVATVIACWLVARFRRKFARSD